MWRSFGVGPMLGGLRASPKIVCVCLCVVFGGARGVKFLVLRASIGSKAPEPLTERGHCVYEASGQRVCASVRVCVRVLNACVRLCFRSRFGFEMAGMFRERLRV